MGRIRQGVRGTGAERATADGRLPCSRRPHPGRRNSTRLATNNGPRHERRSSCARGTNGGRPPTGVRARSARPWESRHNDVRFCLCPAAGAGEAGASVLCDGGRRARGGSAGRTAVLPRFWRAGWEGVAEPGGGEVKKMGGRLCHGNWLPTHPTSLRFSRTPFFWRTANSESTAPNEQSSSVASSKISNRLSPGPSGSSTPL